MNKRVCWAYLDNYDWNWFEGQDEPDWIKNQRQEYEKVGLEYSNLASQNAHLMQSQIIHQYAESRCVIQFDDTWYDHDLKNYSGKGGKAILWLEDNGWKKIYATDGMSIALSNF